MSRRVLGAGSILTLVLVSRAAAQRPMAPTAPTAEDQQMRYQVQKFEAVLVTAVKQGGDAFARLQTQSIPQGVQLTSEDPVVKGFAPPHEGAGLFFFVSVPSIRIGINTLLLQQQSMAARQRPIQPAVPAGARATSQSLVAEPDPMAVSPIADDGRCGTRAKPSAGFPTPDYEYAVAVCDALMDAMLDNAITLPVKENEWLTVAAANGDPGPAGIVNTTSGYTTYLYMKGSDLLALRQGKISRDEARKLVEMKQR